MAPADMLEHWSFPGLACLAMVSRCDRSRALGGRLERTRSLARLPRTSFVSLRSPLSWRPPRRSKGAKARSLLRLGRWTPSAT